MPLPEILSVREDFQKKDPARAADAFREEAYCSGQNSHLFAEL
jgi:hypothetical protein